MTYMQDFDETIPMGGWRSGGSAPGTQSRWYRDMYPYYKNVAIFACPSRKDDSYAPTFSNPAPTDWQVTTPTDWTNDSTNRYAINNGAGTNELRRPVGRHAGGLNIVYCDGHAKWKTVSDFTGVTAARPKGWPYGDPNNSWDNK